MISRSTCSASSGWWKTAHALLCRPPSVMIRPIMATAVPATRNQIALSLGVPVNNCDRREPSDSAAFIPKIMSTKPATSKAIPVALFMMFPFYCGHPLVVYTRDRPRHWGCGSQCRAQDEACTAQSNGLPQSPYHLHLLEYLAIYRMPLFLHERPRDSKALLRAISVPRMWGDGPLSRCSATPNSRGDLWVFLQCRRISRLSPEAPILRGTLS
jgi:hypothetical protein